MKKSKKSSGANPTNKGKKKGKKVKHQKTMQGLPCSVLSCAIHPTQFLRLFKPQTETSSTCKSCGIGLLGQSGYLCCSKSSTCFNLCSVCRVCSNNHPLFRAVSLSHQHEDDELLSQNRYKCNGCKEEKGIGQRGVYHCIPCKFSLCPECIDKNTRLWEETEATETIKQQRIIQQKGKEDQNEDDPLWEGFTEEQMSQPNVIFHEQ